jgi:hypothetical protein
MREISGGSDVKRAIVQSIAQGWGRPAYGRGKVDVEGEGVKKQKTKGRSREAEDERQKTRSREDENTILGRPGNYRTSNPPYHLGFS